MGITSAIGAGASLLGGVLGGLFPQKTTTTSTNTSNTNSSNNSLTTPVEQQWQADLQKSLGGQYQNFINQSAKPVYGQAQEAQQLNTLNSLANNSMNQIQSTFASKGIGNSGAIANALSGINQNRNTNAANYFASIPALNQAAYQSQVGGALNSAAGWIGAPAVGSMTQGSNTSNTNSYGQQVQQGGGGAQGVANNLGGMLGNLGGQYGGLGSLFPSTSFGPQSYAPIGNAFSFLGGGPEGTGMSADPFSFLSGSAGSSGSNPFGFLTNGGNG